VEARTRQPDLLTVDELLRFLRLGRTRTHELLRSGELPSYKVGRRRLIRREDVEIWLEDNRYRPGDG